MSYFVIKGPRMAGQYLCSLPGHACPQWWHRREEANRYPDEESAWKYLEAVAREHPNSCWFGRVIRVNSLRDRKAELAQCRADRDNWRAVADLRRDEIELLRTRLAELSSSKAGSDGE